MATAGTGGTEVTDGVGTGRTVPQPVAASATKINALSDAVMRETVAMIESGMWIFLVEAAAAGGLFIGLIWWVVKGTAARDRRLKEFDEKRRNDAQVASIQANESNKANSD